VTAHPRALPKAEAVSRLSRCARHSAVRCSPSARSDSSAEACTRMRCLSSRGSTSGNMPPSQFRSWQEHSMGLGQNMSVIITTRRGGGCVTKQALFPTGPKLDCQTGQSISEPLLLDGTVSSAAHWSSTFLIPKLSTSTESGLAARRYQLGLGSGRSCADKGRAKGGSPWADDSPAGRLPIGRFPHSFRCRFP
jgi:hypothetical protein